MHMALADRLTAILLFLLGLALLAGGYTMDRLEIRQIHPASIPGLVPMILGVLLSLCAALLFWTSVKTDERNAALVLSGGSWARLGITTTICTVYALGLVGWLPYFWATFVFTTCFTLVFSFPVEGARRAQVISLAGALALGFGVALGSSLLFEKLFLVRLP
ncbi:tripartite tricarboxylate transporter TctB family protein [Vannielia litorea]|uniref:Putative tricarboxylic transport membrane protein n=1 Tax=Vannielia litorea TaxID=1217970 RepID=A0A1N6EYE1_9RHOB|nr:tripartite tricarboxylate transporter TctB family protein [Vannielia litorea]SIN88016.1 putative tricarboxylic transport membrane protein [Vannielia litorea]